MQITTFLTMTVTRKEPVSMFMTRHHERFSDAHQDWLITVDEMMKRLWISCCRHVSLHSTQKKY